MSRAVIFAAAAAVLVCVWLGVSHFGTDGLGNMAFAQILEQIQKAKTITWKTTSMNASPARTERGRG